MCSKCGHAFCIVCNMAYHWTDPCRTLTSYEEKREMLLKYNDAQGDERKHIETLYGGKHNLEKALHDILKLLSEDWVQTNTKPCPQCKFNIQKAEGCNHMQCKKCSSHF